MEEWVNYVEEYLQDNFWIENQPAFHTYNYGANIEIKVNEQLESLPKETCLCQDNKESKSDKGEEVELDIDQLRDGI